LEAVASENRLGDGRRVFDFHPQFSQKKNHRLFYSPDLFMSAMAKREFVEPDLADLPKTTKAADIT
jgi:hypothetical protein